MIETVLTASVDNGHAVSAVLTIETEQIDVTLAVETKPDPKWEFIDSAGHFHAWADSGELPTLATRTRHIPCGDDDCCEGYDEPYYVCAICGEEIEPATITTTPTFRKFAPGRKSWTAEIEGYITRERVSVRLSTGGRELFGVAVPVSVDAKSDVGAGVWTTLAGVGELGQRKSGAVSPA